MTVVTITISDAPATDVGLCAHPGCELIALRIVTASEIGYQAVTASCPFHVRASRVKALRMLADAAERELAEEAELRSHGAQTMPAPLL